MKYRVRRFDMRMTKKGDNRELFLDCLEREAVFIVPSVTVKDFWIHVVDLLMIKEKLP